MDRFFDDFELTTHWVSGGLIRLRIGDKGPARSAPARQSSDACDVAQAGTGLARDHTIVCPDLRGYGGETGSSPDHAPYAKRAMARDMLELMVDLGHPRFSVIAHDRGARVAHRLAIDFPDRVERLAILDIVPTLEH